MLLSVSDTCVTSSDLASVKRHAANVAQRNITDTAHSATTRHPRTLIATIINQRPQTMPPPKPTYHDPLLPSLQWRIIELGAEFNGRVAELKAQFEAELEKLKERFERELEKLKKGVEGETPSEAGTEYFPAAEDVFVGEVEEGDEGGMENFPESEDVLVVEIGQRWGDTCENEEVKNNQAEDEEDDDMKTPTQPRVIIIDAILNREDSNYDDSVNSTDSEKEERDEIAELLKMGPTGDPEVDGRTCELLELDLECLEGRRVSWGRRVG